MNKLRYIIIVLVGSLLFSCDVDYFEDPNQPEIAPTYGLMNRVQKRLMDDTRDAWFSGRMALLWVQYWNQVNYTEEDRFQYRETVNQGGWDDLYKNAQDLIDIIQLNTDEETKDAMLQYGPNENQIAAARIMLAFVYLQATEVWGDVPYWSYGNNDPDFQANQIKVPNPEDRIDTPAYAAQSKIYADLLKELKEASEMIITSEKMIDGDNFYGGDAEQWQKLANSLRLRIANRVKDVYPAATTHINEAVTAGVFEGNEDNAGVKYEANALNGAPMYRAFVVSAREDFAPSMQLVELLQGKRSVFGADPRLDIYVADNADGVKVGIPLTENNGEVNKFKHESFPGSAILAPDYTEIYMEYSEVCFILSEINGWDQSWYEKGVEASMQKWGVDKAAIDAFIFNLPAASEETVMMQKYIALYMQPYEAWSEYRRTGYPNTLVKPNDVYDYTWTIADRDGDGNITGYRDTTATFNFAVIENINDQPYRVKYLLNEASINEESLDAAIASMGGDKMDTKLWWQP